MRRPLAGLALAAFLAGCVSTFTVSPPAPHDYRIDYAPPAIDAPPLPVVVQLGRFRTAATYASEGIVYREGPHSTGTYVYHRWSASPGSMLRDLFVRDLAAAGTYRAVVHQGTATLVGDYELSGEIDEIEERVLGDGCAGHVVLRVLLVRLRGDRDPVVLRTNYNVDETCEGTGPAAVVAAISRAVAQISSRLQRDVYEAIANDRRAISP